MPDPEETSTSRSLWIVDRERCEMRADPLPPSGAGTVLVESLFGAISRGTERLVFEARVPPAEHERMRAPNQDGDFPFPVKYGYASVGRVAEPAADLAGRTVFCLYPHQDRFRIEPTALVPVPADVPAARAVLGANMETALNIVWDAGVSPGDRVTIVGGGLVGLLTAFLAARVPGVDARLVEIDAGRRPVAEALGVAFESPEACAGERDIVIHASGSAAGLATAIALGGFEARIVEASWYGDRAVETPLGGAFHSQRLSIVASQVGSLPPMRRARWTHRRRLECALALLADPRLDVLISGETPFRELPAAYGAILSAPGTLCHRIRYD